MMTKAGARSRALRAARVVTMGLVLAAPGCYVAYERPAEVVGDASVTIDAALERDAGLEVDAASDGAIAHAGCDREGEDWLACCDAIDWDWSRGCTAWGPFCPPSDGELAGVEVA